MMKAAVVTDFGGPEVLQIQDVPVPNAAAGEIVVRVGHAGVGFVDTLLRSGYFDLLTPPFIPGIEVCGEIVEIGDGVDDFTVGQRVVALLNDFFRGSNAGGYAERVVARADLVIPLPDGCDPAEAAGVVANGATAWMSLVDVARVGKRDSLLILGATGGVGAMAARIARTLEVAHIVGVTGSAERAHLARVNGCTEVLIAPDQTALSAIAPDVVFDPVGGAMRVEALAALRPLGRYLVVGNASGIDSPVMPDALWHASHSIAGFSLGGVAHVVPSRVRQAIASVVDRLATHELPGPPPAIFPLSDVADSHRLIEERAALGKVVLEIEGP